MFKVFFTPAVVALTILVTGCSGSSDSAAPSPAAAPVSGTTTPVTSALNTFGTIVGDVTEVEAVSKYRWNSAIAAYDATRVKTRTLGDMKGTGKLSTLQSSLNKDESRVPGINYKGHDRVNLVEKNGQLVIVKDYAIDDTVDGVTLNLAYSTEIEVEITNGMTIKDLKLGKKIELKPTEKGRDALVKANVKVFDDVMKVSLAQGLKDQSLAVSSTLDKVEVSENIRYEIDKTDVTVISPSVRFVMTFTINRK